MEQFTVKLRELWDRLTARQRIQLGVAVVGTLAVIWGMTIYAGRVQYDVLLGGLDSDDAGQIVEALRERQVPYRLSSGGRTIEVPAGRVDELRLELAQERLLPGGGVGFEIFDKPSFGLSDFAQNVNYRRALQRELARTIQSLHAVDAARVHLALPKESVFAGETKRATASVVVTLKGGSSLSRERVQAISHLVAAGVEALDPDGVSVIDDGGRLLSDPDADPGSMSASQQDSKRAMEQEIEATLVSMLEPIVGPGRVRASATVELNMKRVERTEERYDPASAVVRSESKSKSSSSDAARAGGVPGTASNLPEGGPAAAAGGGGAKNTQQTTQTNFEINRTVATIAEPVGTLARQSVAVVVDHAPAGGGEGEADAGGGAGRPRTNEEMQKIEQVVSAAIGIDLTRGDVLSVSNIPFDPAAAVEVGSGGGFGLDSVIRAVRYLSLPLAVLLMALFVIRPGIQAVRGLAPPVTESDALPPTVAALQARLHGGDEGVLPKMFGDTSPMRVKLIEAAREDPQAAAIVLRGWLDDSKERS